MPWDIGADCSDTATGGGELVSVVDVSFHESQNDGTTEGTEEHGNCKTVLVKLLFFIP